MSFPPKSAFDTKRSYFSRKVKFRVKLTSRRGRKSTAKSLVKNLTFKQNSFA